VLQELKAGTAVGDVCRAFGLAHTTIAQWRRRYAEGGYEALFGRKPGKTKQAKKEDPRREAVLALKKAHPEYGTRRIRDVLKRFQAIGISESEVRRMLHEAGLLEASATAAPREQPERRFERAEPNQLWQSDIFTFLLRRHERVYLCAFLDDNSRFITGWALQRHQKSTLVAEALEAGIARYGAPKEILTDNGRQYSAWRGETEFDYQLKRQGIQHLKSRPQHPQTLGKIERFWKTLWEEFLSRTVFNNFEDLARRLQLYIDGYNFQRPHQALEGLVPADRFFRVAQHVRAAVEEQVRKNALLLAQERPTQKPFYLVGKLGDHDVSIAAGEDGLRVQLGKEEPQTIRLTKEDEDERAQASRRVREATKAPSAADAAVAAEEAGAGRDRAAAHADDPERTQRAAAGDGRDRAGADLAGPLLPAGGAGAARGAFGDGAGSVAGAVAGDHNAALAAGGPGQAAGGGQAATGAALDDDAQGAAAAADEDGPGPAVLGERWEERFRALDAGDEERVRLTDLVERDEHPLTWPRKVAGADASSDARAAEVRDEHVHDPAEAVAGDCGEVRGDPASAQRSDHGDGDGGEAGAVASADTHALEPGCGGSAGVALAEEVGPQGDAGAGAQAAGRSGAAAQGERPAAGPGGDDRPADGSGKRDPARPGADALSEGAQEAEGGRGQ
jgi:transposase InsO family protein